MFPILRPQSDAPYLSEKESDVAKLRKIIQNAKSQT